MNFSNVINRFLYEYPAFLFELMFCEATIFFYFKRKKLFWAKLAAGIITLAGITFLCAVLREVTDGKYMIGSAIYMLMFLFTVCIALMCFNKPIGDIVFGAIAAYALQNLNYRIYSLLELYGVIYRFSQGVNIQYYIASLIFNAAITVISCALAYLFTVRRLRAQKGENIFSIKVLALSAITLVVTVFLCGTANTYWWQHWYLCVVVCWFSIITCFFVLCLYSGALQQANLVYEMAVIKKLWEMDKLNYEQSKESAEIINIKCHDLKYKLEEIKASGGKLPDDEIAEMENAVEKYDCKSDTGCPPLDVLLTEKAFYCKSHGIRFTSYSDGGALNFMSATDIYSLFGNLLSNAIEASERLKNDDLKVIALRIFNRGDLIAIEAENYYEGKISFVGEVPVSRKEDKNWHGFGVKSMKMLVKKYGGDMYISTDSNVFRVKILFYAKSEGKNGEGADLKKTA